MEDQRRSPQPLHVLLVEDSTWTIDSLTELVHSSSASTELHIARSETEAIESVALRTADVVILDLKLKEGHGFRVLRKLTALAQRPTIIVLTNYALPKYRDLAMVMGADMFLDKATEMQRIPSILDSVAHRRQLLDVN